MSANLNLNPSSVSIASVVSSANVSTTNTPFDTRPGTPITEPSVPATPIEGPSLFEVHDFLLSLARKAGEMIRASDAAVADASDTKRNTSDRVTATDRAVEKMVSSTIAKTYPSHLFLGEETFKTGQILTDAPTFVCDPIDGTLNFIHGFPNCAVSLAMTINKQPVVGVVYNPGRDDMFSAIKGHGAFLRRGINSAPERLPLRAPAPLNNLNDALVAVEWGNQRSGPNWDLRSSVAMRLLSAQSNGGAMVHSVRSNGSAALDFCYVGAGWIDAFWEGGCWIWDVCAGWLIVEEAGGIVVGANPGEWDATLEGRSYFCVRGAQTHEQHNIVHGVWDLMDGRSFSF